MNKKVLTILSITIIIVLAVFLKIFFIKSVKYDTVRLQPHTISQVVEASGTINPVNTVSVGSTVSGLMKEVYVDFNSQVKAGQLIAKMDTNLLQANVDKAKNNYDKQSAITEHSLKTYNRCKNLVARNFMAKSELDAAQAEYLSNRALLNAAKADYEYAKTQCAYAYIYSPVDGIIVTRNVDPGQSVAASFQAPELFTVTKDLKEMQIEVNVSEADIGKIREGQEVDYTLDGYPDEVFKGKVSQVRISPTTVSNVVTYTVIVKVDNEDLKLKPGMTANVSIITVRKKDVLCIPSIALKFAPVEKGEIKRYENQGIWILQNNKPKRVEIKTGASDDSYTEILKGDITKDDKIIIGTVSGKSSKQKKGNRPPMRMF